ncbi:MAG: hypothetical protein ALAOOOJD_02564 [bacterium]|nr:hypothetical protein [bacterium]
MATSLPRSYLDTSIPSAYYNDRQRERLLLTQHIWHEKLPNYHVVISNITQRELHATKNSQKRKKLERLVHHFDILIADPACANLADDYLRILSMPKYDAWHIAMATVFGCEKLLSWDFVHIVNDDNRQKINETNLQNGYPTINILSPLEL